MKNSTNQEGQKTDMSRYDGIVAIEENVDLETQMYKDLHNHKTN